MKAFYYKGEKFEKMNLCVRKISDSGMKLTSSRGLRVINDTRVKPFARVFGVP